MSSASPSRQESAPEELPPVIVAAPHAEVPSAGRPTLLGQEAGARSIAGQYEMKPMISSASTSTEFFPGQAESWESSMEMLTADGGLIQMSGDRCCIRTMHVKYIDALGQPQEETRKGYNCTVFIQASSRDVEVSFDCVAGGSVCKVDREDNEMHWCRDEHGHRVPERFFYSAVPDHVQFFIRGPSMRSWVSQVDMRAKTANLIELVSCDYLCVRTMRVTYCDPAGGKKSWSASGYNVKFHIPRDAKDVEVTFSVVGGRDVHRVERRLPGMPWFEDFNGHKPVERFTYACPPACVQYEARGSSLKCYISRVREQYVHCDQLAPDHLLRDLPPCFDAAEQFQNVLSKVPAVGGIVDLETPHSDFLLPAQVALFEPSQDEIFSTKGARQIFANTPLLESEIASLGGFHEHLAKSGIGGRHGSFPRYMEVHALRMLQTSKFNFAKAASLMDFIAKERVTRLPMTEAIVVQDLKRGFIYWHGRDRWCRPCMVIRLERLGELAKDKEAALRVVVYTLEYALRFAMCPGRVENWVVILDLANITSIISPWQISGLISTATALGKTLEQVYCGRMVWLKIVNMPGGDILRRSINSAIPTEKRDKVSFSRDIAAELKDRFEPNQLEQRYGGEAPDVVPGEAYPFRFFPNCRGGLAERHEHHSEAGSGLVDPEDFSLHEATSLQFHEGMSWDTSSRRAREKWVERAKASSLTPAAADALSKMVGGEPIMPCSDPDHWLSLVLQPGTSMSRATSGCYIHSSPQTRRRLGSPSPEAVPYSPQTPEEGQQTTPIRRRSVAFEAEVLVAEGATTIEVNV